MSFWDRLRFASRERVTATDVNRLHTLLGKDLADMLMYMFHDHNDLSTFASGRKNGVIGGLLPTDNGNWAAPVVSLEPGMTLQYDDTSAITDLTDPELGTMSAYRLGRLDSTDTLSFSLGAPPPTGRSYLIEVHHKRLEIEEQSRDIMDAIVNLFAPENIVKRYRPAMEVHVNPGPVGVNANPGVDPGWIPICWVWSHPASLLTHDVRPFLHPRMIGYPATGSGLDASLYNTVGLYDTSAAAGDLPGTAVGAIDSTTGLIGYRGFIAMAVGSGLHVYDTTTGQVVLTATRDASGGIFRVRTAAGVTYLDVSGSQVKLNGISFVVYDAPGGNIKARIDASGDASFGNYAIGTPRVRVNGASQNITIYNPSGIAEGLIYNKESLPVTERNQGGFMTTDDGAIHPTTSDYRQGMGFCYWFPFNAAGGILAQYEAVQIVQSAVVGGAPAVRRAQAGATQTGEEFTNPAAGAKGLLFYRRVDGIALGPATVNGDMVLVCLLGVCIAAADSNVLLPSEPLVLSSATHGILMLANDGVIVGGWKAIGRCATVLSVVYPGGPPFLYKILFRGNMEGEYY